MGESDGDTCACGQTVRPPTRDGSVSPLLAKHVLKAGAMIAEAVAGPQFQKVQHTLADQHAALAFAVAEDARGACVDVSATVASGVVATEKLGAIVVGFFGLLSTNLRSQ